MITCEPYITLARMEMDRRVRPCPSVAFSRSLPHQLLFAVDRNCLFYFRHCSSPSISLLRELSDMMSVKFPYFLTTSPLVRIWI